MFSLMIPFKGGPTAKTRLLVDTPVVHGDLVRAFAADAAAAALACPLVDEVYAVTNDDFPLAGVRILPDDGAGDLNVALSAAASRLEGSRIVAMVADLPCLTPDDLTDALGQVRGRAFVADHDGTGTTLLATTTGHLVPAYGVDSARRHRESGAVPLVGALATLRHDVDTRTALREAITLGVGERTAAVLSAADR